VNKELQTAAISTTSSFILIILPYLLLIFYVKLTSHIIL